MKRILSFALLLALVFSLTVLPAQAANLSSYATASFSRSYDVYSGPGNHYYRANGGKAMYGGGTVRIYGRTGDWLMIGYQLSSGNYRIGYISSDALNYIKNNLRGSYDDNLTFNGTVSFTVDASPVTDDPIIKCEAVCTVPAGTKVNVLAWFENNWAYCELTVNSQLMRGCIRGTHLSNVVPTGGGHEDVTPIPQPTKAPATVAPTYIYPTYPVITPVPTAAPTAIPSVYGNLNSYAKTSIFGSWEVYSGPGTSYYRAANGRAQVGGGNIRVYGIVNGWVLIGYGFSNGGYRLGYISASAMANMSPAVSVPVLKLNNYTMTVRYTTELTDDPVCYKPALMGIPAGTRVTFLGVMSKSLDTDWAYVELPTTQGVLRGFIPLSSLGGLGSPSY